jgi:hypothetical protein
VRDDAAKLKDPETLPSREAVEQARSRQVNA